VELLKQFHADRAECSLTEPEKMGALPYIQLLNVAEILKQAVEDREKRMQCISVIRLVGFHSFTSLMAILNLCSDSSANRPGSGRY
jgi:hypothetical protein